MSRQCDICPEIHYSKGYCRKHYSAWKKHGDPLVQKRWPNQPKPVCEYGGDCKEPQKARGWCATHYARWKRTGSVELRERPKCSEDDCEEEVDSKDLCKRHYQRARRRGEIPGPKCTKPGCGRAHAAQGYCNQHYREAQRDRTISVAKCSEDGCERGAYSSGRCAMHADRVRKTGEAGPSGPLFAVDHDPKCCVPKCEREYRSLGYCDMHYQRVRAYGEPGSAEPKPDWEFEVGYDAIHWRLRNYRGSAETHKCADCERSAVEWSYTYEGGALERYYARHENSSPLAYSLDIAHYVPRCKKCHMAHDFRVRQQRMEKAHA